MGGFQIFVWNPATGNVDKESLQTHLQYLPARMITLRIFSEDHSHDEVLARAAEKTLKKHWPELLSQSSFKGRSKKGEVEKKESGMKNKK
jgi:hypothetical protein